MEQPRGSCARAAGRISRDGKNSQRDCVRGKSQKENLRGAISPGSESHRPRHGNFAEFSVYGVQGGSEVERRGVYRRNGGSDTEEGGDAPGDLRIKRGSGLDSGGGAGASSDSGPADEYICEYRNAEEERIRAHPGDVPGAVEAARGGG